MGGVLAAPLASPRPCGAPEKPSVFHCFLHGGTLRLPPTPLGKWCRTLFFRFLMDSMFAAPFAELFELNLAFYRFLVFSRVVVQVLADATAEFY